ncbi:MAG: NUDIX domain-containing protein, partial [Candidatus Bathyarchaeota archaeon]
MPLPSVDILAVYEGRLLLMKRRNEPGRGLWFTPGGQIRYGETLEQTVLRELTEETGLTPLKIEMKGTMCHIWPDTHYVTSFFRVEVDGDDVEIDDEHSEYRWVSKLPEDAHPFIISMVESSGIF